TSRALALLPPTPCSMTILRSNLAASSMAGPSSLRLCALLMPTEEPKFAGFTNTGYFSLLVTSFSMRFGYFCQALRRTVTCLAMDRFRWNDHRFAASEHGG